MNTLTRECCCRSLEYTFGTTVATGNIRVVLIGNQDLQRDNVAWIWNSDTIVFYGKQLERRVNLNQTPSPRSERIFLTM